MMKKPKNGSYQYEMVDVTQDEDTSEPPYSKNRGLDFGALRFGLSTRVSAYLPKSTSIPSDPIKETVRNTVSAIMVTAVLAVVLVISPAVGFVVLSLAAVLYTLFMAQKRKAADWVKPSQLRDCAVKAVPCIPPVHFVM
jgi:hypothetical protein